MWVYRFWIPRYVRIISVDDSIYWSYKLYAHAWKLPPSWNLVRPDPAESHSTSSKVTSDDFVLILAIRHNLPYLDYLWQFETLVCEFCVVFGSKNVTFWPRKEMVTRFNKSSQRMNSRPCCRLLLAFRLQSSSRQIQVSTLGRKSMQCNAEVVRLLFWSDGFRVGFEEMALFAMMTAVPAKEAILRDCDVFPMKIRSAGHLLQPCDVTCQVKRFLDNDRFVSMSLRPAHHVWDGHLAERYVGLLSSIYLAVFVLCLSYQGHFWALHLCNGLLFKGRATKMSSALDCPHDIIHFHKLVIDLWAWKWMNWNGTRFPKILARIDEMQLQSFQISSTLDPNTSKCHRIP